MPVKKKSNALLAAVADAVDVDRIQSRKPPIRNSRPPPTISQSDVLNLLRSTAPARSDGWPAVDANVARRLDRPDRIARRRGVVRTVDPCRPRCCPCTTRPASSTWPGVCTSSAGRCCRAAARRRAIADAGLPGHRRRRAHRVPGDPRPPRRHAAPEGARRHPRRPDRSRAPSATSPSTASSRSTSSSSTSTRSPADPGIELIDVGGPAMVRAAAKNHAHVGVVVDPGRLRRRCSTSCAPTGALSRRHPAAAGPRPRSPAPPPTTRRSSTGSTATARPPAATAPTPCCPTALHARPRAGPGAALRREPAPAGAPATAPPARTGWWDGAVQHGGKELSYLNLFDTEAAWRLVHRFDEPACVIVKHANPCGVAVADDITDRLRAGQRVRPGQRLRRHRRRQPAGARRRWPRRWPRCSPRSWWRPGLRRRRAGRADGQDEPARAVGAAPPGRPERSTCARSTAGCSCSSPTPSTIDRGDVVGRHRRRSRPTQQWDDLEFAWTVCAAVSSNAIVLAKDGQAFGIGAGQQNRVDSARIAADPGRRPGRRRRVRQRRLLPVPRRPRRRRRRRRRRRHPARRQRPRRRGRSPPPTSTASPWSSPASATSGTEHRLPDAGCDARIGARLVGGRGRR